VALIPILAIVLNMFRGEPDRQPAVEREWVTGARWQDVRPREKPGFASPQPPSYID